MSNDNNSRENTSVSRTDEDRDGSLSRRAKAGIRENFGNISRRQFIGLTAGIAAIQAGTNLVSGASHKLERVPNTEEWSEVVRIIIENGELGDGNIPDGDEVPDGSAGSGVLIDEFHVLTAAHVVADHKPNNITIYPAMARDEERTRYYYPFDQAEVTHIQSHPESDDFNNDIAVLTLDRRVGSDAGAGSRSIYWANSRDDNTFEQRVRLIGYPNEAAPSHTMWLVPAEGQGISSQLNVFDDIHDYDLELHNDWNTSDGLSGSPLINENGDVISIHSYTDDVPLLDQSWAGVWFNKDRSSWVRRVQDEDDPPDDLAMPVFNRDTWDLDANTRMFFEIDGDLVTEADELPYEIIAGEDTLQVKHDVRNVGPIADESLEIEFRLDRLGEDPKDGVVKDEVAFKMPDPYETKTVDWEYKFSEDDIDNDYRVVMEIVNVDWEAYLSTADPSFKRPVFLKSPSYPSNSPPHITVVESHDEEDEESDPEDENEPEDEEETEEDDEPDAEEEDESILHVRVGFDLDNGPRTDSPPDPPIVYVERNGEIIADEEDGPPFTLENGVEYMVHADHEYGSAEQTVTLDGDTEITLTIDEDEQEEEPEEDESEEEEENTKTVWVPDPDSDSCSRMTVPADAHPDPAFETEEACLEYNGGFGGGNEDTAEETPSEDDADEG